MLNSLRPDIGSFCRNIYCLFLLVLVCFSSELKADGSRELYPAGATGNRAFLYCNTNSSWTDTWPFKTAGTHYAYLKIGEVIAAASSAQGYDSGTIIITSPDGTTYTSSNSVTIGRIINRNAEIAGPNNGVGAAANRYTPYEKQANIEGIWRVDFIPPTGLTGTADFAVPDVSATANWTQGTLQNGTADVIAAWDVSVRSGTNWISGRVYTNVLNLVVKDSFTEGKSYYAVHYVLTKDGRAYKIRTNGNNGVGFTFFSNSNGFAINSIPTYKSLNFSERASIIPFTHDPRIPDEGNNVTHKIFYTKPSPDLPASSVIYISGSISSTWLKNTAVLPKITDLVVVGKEGTIGQAGNKGAFINFKSTTGGTYKITIPVIAPGTDRVIIGVAAVGDNSVFWDGKDGSGNFVPAGTTISQLKTKLQSAEVHFPYIDMEINPRGLIIELTDNTTGYNLQTTSTDEGVYSNKVYWDDSDISGAGVGESSNPFKNSSGLSSITNGHIWGSYNSNSGSGNSGTGGSSFGNNKSMDTWTYIQGSEESQPMALEIKSADLMVQNIVPIVNTYFTDHNIIYKIRVKNDGPSDISGATFDFKAPPGYNITSVVPAVISGTASVNSPVVSGSTYQSKLTMNNQVVIEFTVSGTVVAPLLNQIFTIEASILRPSDVTDPDATDPNSTTPTDPHLECYNGTGVKDCNNIKYNTIDPQELCLGADIRPIEYLLSIGGTLSRIIGSVPAVLNNIYTDPTKTSRVSGKVNAAGIYNFTLGTLNSEKETTTAIIKVNPLPAIVSQPVATPVCEGTDAVFSVTSDGTDTYQWQYEEGGVWKNFANAGSISGATTTTLKISSIPLTDHGKKVKVIITSAFGCSIVSTEIKLVVNARPVDTNFILGSKYICEGGTVQLRSSVSGAVGYQWFYNGAVIPGANQRFYNAANAGRYSVAISNALGCLGVKSDELEVVLVAFPAIPNITHGPLTVCIGSSVILKSDPASTYQWYLGDDAINGATSQEYTAATSGSYSVVITNIGGCAESSARIPIVISPLPNQPGITGTAVICAGDVAVLTSDAAAGYQWYFNGTAIPSATGRTYDAKLAGKYTVIVTNENGCFSPASSEFELTVNTLPNQPGITGTAVICAGDVAVLTADLATAYQWYLNGTAIPSATGRTYDAKIAGKYTVIVTNTNGCFSPVSSEFELTVNTLPNQPGITGTAVICSGDVAVLTADLATGYQWYLNGTAIPSATGRTYDAKIAGKYTVIVTNANGCFSPASSEFEVTVNTLPNQPGITGTAVICAGDVAVLTADLATAYQWYFNGTAIPSATGRTYDAKIAGKYTVIVTNTNGCFSPVSSEFELTVNTLPNQPGITGTAVICAGDVAVLTSDAAAGYQWYFNGTAIPSATGRTYDAKLAGKYTVIVTNTNGCFSPVSSEFELTVNTLPNQPGITGTAVICAGDVAVLTADLATGYQWYLNGTAIPSATGRTYDAKLAGKYTVIVTNANGCFSPVSSEFELTVNTLPNQPGITGTAVICAGDVAVLTSDAAAGYQWYFNGTAIPSATGRTYDAKLAGKYTVIVTNTNGCFSPVSSEFELTVNTLPNQPGITGTAVICSGDVAVLTSDAAAGYQWYFNGTAIPSATGRTYDAKLAGKYTVIVTNANGCFSPVSSEFELTVNTLPNQPGITGTAVICAGDVAVLTADLATAYQWYFNGTAIPSATGRTYDAKLAGKYTVIVTNANGCFSPVSSEFELTVNTLPNQPGITGTAVICAGDVAVLTADLATGYQWYLNGTAIPSATGRTYDAKLAGKYTVLVTNTNGCFSPVSSEFELTVNTLPNQPGITGTAVICAGDVAVLTSDAAAGYQWYFNGTAIPSATGRTYDAKLAGKYTVIVTNTNGCFSPVSGEFELTVNTLPNQPGITGTAVICAGDVAVLTSDVAAGYQWYLNGTAIPSATGRTYDAKIAGKYTVIVTNTNGCFSPVSGEFELTVNTLPNQPGITGTAVICAGDVAVLTSDVAAGYQWYFNGTAIPSATGRTYDAKLAGKYTVIVTNTNGCFSPVSSEFELTVNTLPNQPGITGTAVICAGDVAVLTADLATAYQWYFNGTAIPSATGRTYDAKIAGKYTVIVTNTNGCFSPVSSEFELTVNTLPNQPGITGTAVICSGDVAVLTADLATGYQWYLNGTAIPSATGRTYDAKIAGKYTVIVTNANGCFSPASSEFEVTVNTLPNQPGITGTAVICAGDVAVLTADLATAYQWYFNGTAIPSATGRTYDAKIAGKYTVIVTNTNGCFSPASSEFELTVNTLPNQPGITGTAVICAGDVAVLTSDAAAGYQWYFNGTAIPSATGRTYDAKIAGKYTVIVTNTNGCFSPVSSKFELTVNTLPNQPGITGTAVICAGDVAVLTADLATAYQWYFNGTAIPSATGRTYDAKIAGKYTVIVTNTNGCFSPVSSEFELTVNTLPNQPGITGTAVICSGDVAVLTADLATGYQWYLNGTAIPSATGRTYDAKIAGKYTVIVTNANGCFSPASSEFEVTVNTLPNQPGITGTAVICAGDVAVLTADLATAYQWYFNGTAIPSATGRTYDAKIAGKYTVIVTNTNGCFSPVSSEFELTVNTLPNQPGITGTAVICAGDVAVLTSDAAAGYQWYFNGTAIPSATGRTYDAKIAGKYTVIVTNTNGCFSPVSSEFELTVNTLPNQPGITGTAVICAGDVAVLTADLATGYQWYLNGTAIPSATGRTYDAKIAGKYTVIVTNANGCFSPASSEFEVTVNTLPNQPGITGTAVICAGDVAVLTADLATAYQWYFNGTAIPSATGRTYDAKIAGKYTVIVTNTNGCFSPASSEFELTVNTLPNQPGITGTAVICAGDVAVLTSDAAAGYQWYFNGTAIPSATGRTYDAKIAGKYTVIVTNTNGCFSPVSSEFELTVNTLPNQPGITGTAVICAGDVAVLTADLATGYQWYLNGTAIPSATGRTYDAKLAGKYTVIVTNTNGCFSPVSSEFELTVNTLPNQPGITGTAVICAGDVAVLTADLATGYQWYLNGTAIPSATGRTYDAKLAGKYTVLVTNTNGCFSPVSSEFELTVNTLPNQPGITGTAVICSGDVAVLTSDAAAGYQWYLNGTAIPSATGRTYDAKLAGKYTVIVTNTNGCFSPVSSEFELTVNTLPNQPGITGTAVICAGDVAVLTSDAAAGYQWYFNGTAIPSATGRTYDAKLAGKYTVIVTNTNGCFSPVSSEFELTVNTLPNQPGITGMAVICAGDVAVLTSDAAAGYQWYFNGTAIPSATGRTYDAKIAGKYTVIVTNTNGCFSQVSSEFELTVNTLPNQPGITGTAVICAGDVAVLTSDAAAGYQWYFNGTVIPSAKGRTYNAKLAGKYTVIVTNTNGCFSPVSSKFELTVNTLPNQPGITGTAVICAGDVAVLTSDASTGNQWYLNGIAISGATGKRYEAKISGKYTVVVTDALPCSSLVSNEIEVTVNPLPATPTVSAGVAPTTFCIGGSVTLTSSSATGNQWYKDGSILTGETGQTYVANASGDYTIVVTNTTTGCPSAASLALKVTVNPLPATPTVSAGVAPTIFCAGGSVTLTSSSGTGNQWYKDGSILTGETGQTYIANASGDYTVVVTNATTLCPSAASAALKVTVNPLPSTPTVSAGGAPTTFCAGGSVTLTSSSATGNQWFKGSQAIPGAINATYITSEAGVYTVRVTNASNCISASADVNVIVNELPIVPTIIVNANDLTFCEGGSVTLTSSSDTGNQWYKNGQEIPGASNKTYTTTEAGNYTVKVTNASGCYSLSSTATVMVNRLPAAPTIIVNANDLTFCEGGSVTLTSSAAAGNQWYKDGEVIPGATGKTYTTSIGAQYMLIVTNTNGCSSAPAQPVQATVVAYPVKPNISPAGTTTFCEGGFVTLTSNAANGNQWYKNGTLIPGATNQTFDVSEIGNYTVKVTNATGCASAISALTNVTVNQVPKGYNDQINSLNCTQSSFSYNLQTNVNDIAKGGNAVPALFTWTASSSIVTGVSNGSGKTINASLINTSAVAQSIAYTVTPVAETGGCAGQPFVITVQVPVCIAISINKVADKATVSAVGDKLTYTITVRNDGNANHNQVKVTDAMFGGRLNQPQGDNGNGILEKGEAWIYKQSYTITQSDLDNNGWPVIGTGKIINTANVSSLEEILPKTVNAEVNIQNNPSLTLVKTGKMDRGFKTITYTFKITNNGNVTLYNLALTDPKFTTPITLKQTTLIPGASTTETGIYTITEPEKVAGITTNTATIVGFTKPGIKVTDVSGTTEQNDEPTIIDITRYPVAIDDYASTKAEEEVAVPIVNNDRPALFPLNFATVDVKTQPSNGKIVVGKDGKVTYKPNKGFFGTERFTYKIADDNGLSSNIAEVRIDVAPPPLDIPNTFTPNGDGKNDTFVIVGMENYEMVSIFVYNRWGDEVYRNNNYKNEWDGNGLNEGTYFYVLKLKKGKTEETRRSWVLIKR
jgi:gliding motility-associated-like protein/uncharacterized repeat protein (TIGR01451 family)